MESARTIGQLRKSLSLFYKIPYDYIGIGGGVIMLVFIVYNMGQNQQFMIEQTNMMSGGDIHHLSMLIDQLLFNSTITMVLFLTAGYTMTVATNIFIKNRFEKILLKQTVVYLQEMLWDQNIDFESRRAVVDVLNKRAPGWSMRTI